MARAGPKCWRLEISRNLRPVRAWREEREKQIQTSDTLVSTKLISQKNGVPGESSLHGLSVGLDFYKIQYRVFYPEAPNSAVRTGITRLWWIINMDFFFNRISRPVLVLKISWGIWGAFQVTWWDGFASNNRPRLQLQSLSIGYLYHGFSSVKSSVQVLFVFL